MRTLFLVYSFFLVGCASYQHKVAGFQYDLFQANYDSAIKKIEPLAKKKGDDQLVYLLDYGLALQAAGRYKESTQAFLLAEKIAEVKDYHSLSRIGGSLLFNEAMVQYKGDDFEKVLINAYLAINFTLEKNLDGARVEARKLNNKLYKYRYEAKRKYEQNPFAFYLSAVLWEDDKNYDSAYIDYEKAYNRNPNFSLLQEDLLRLSYLSRRPDKLKKWSSKFPNIKINKKIWRDRSQGEVFIIYQQGKGPQKRPRKDNFRLPELVPRISKGVRARIIVNEKITAETKKIFDLTNVAIQSFNDQYGELIAKRMAAFLAKRVAADQIRQKDEGLGNLALLVMDVTDQADTRQWGSLPSSMQIARIKLLPGVYNIQLQALSVDGSPTGEESINYNINIKAGKRSFLNWRSYN